MQSVPVSILELVERFSLNRSQYRSNDYNEAQLRREFLEPFFEALGWDVSNRSGYADAYKDVIHEDSIKIGAATKAPDYCFRVGGTRKFFVEAKRPSVDISTDISPAYQLRRYAWSATLPVSVLSDFEAFAIYDCRFKPSQSDPASKGRIFYCTWEQYSEKWPEIASILAKDAVLKGSLDRFAQGLSRTRGTTTVDDAFLQEIEQWRDTLAESIAMRNPDLSQRELNSAVTRTIDRIIFLRICEDRGIERYGQLQAVSNGDGVYGRLMEIFRQADQKYNSGLFHFSDELGQTEDPDELTPGLTVDDKTLRTILRSLYYPESPYEFSVLPADILGQVYEQFLGKVIRLTPGHRAKVEEKPDVRKAGGVFYTPTYVVDYIVAATVGKILAGKNLPNVADIRVLDPACGSGSFLLGAYQFLLDWHLKYYSEHATERFLRQKSPPIRSITGTRSGQSGTLKLTLAERKRILINNIFGVDIDANAVETTKLSLLLKALEGESQESLNNQLRLFRERALPNLANNIKCGNSLIGPDFFASRQLSLLDDETLWKINAFEWRSEFKPIMDAGGFDAVVGNPPYGASLDEPQKEYLALRFRHQNYQPDTYLLFLEQAVRNLLRQGGLLGVIIPNPWLTNLRQRQARRFICSESQINEIVHFQFPVFRQATVDTQILTLQKADPRGAMVSVKIARSREDFIAGDSSISVLRHSQDLWRDLDGDVINIFLNAPDRRIAKQCASAGVPLESICNINVGIKPYQVGKGSPPQSRRIVDTRCYDADEPLGPLYRQYIRGADIARFKISPKKARFIKYGPWLAEPRPAANFNAPEKIVMRQTGDSLIAALDKDKLLCLNNMHVVTVSAPDISPLYILGILNARLINWYYRTLNPEVGEALAEVKKGNVAALPVRPIDFSSKRDRGIHDRLVDLVRTILELHKKLSKLRIGGEQIHRQIEAQERHIDQLVYDIYGLTADEIAIVEGSLGSAIHRHAPRLRQGITGQLPDDGNTSPDGH